MNNEIIDYNTQERKRCYDEIAEYINRVIADPEPYIWRDDRHLGRRPHPSITEHLEECSKPIDGVEYARRFKEKIRQRYESPKEAFEQLRGKSGKINRTDFKRALRHLDLDRSAAITDLCRKDLRKLMDRSGDKEITYPEFELFMHCSCKKITRCKVHAKPFEFALQVV